MKVRKLLALVLAVAMVMSLIVIPQAVFAKDTGNPGTVSPNRANISFEYLGKTTGNAAQSNYKALIEAKGGSTTNPAAGDVSEIEANDVIWIGVRFSNMTKVKDVLKSDQVGGPTGGIGDMTFSMTYDNEYLTPLTAGARVFLANGLINNYFPKVDCEDSGESDLILYTGSFENGGSPVDPSGVLQGAEEIKLSKGSTHTDYKDIVEKISIAQTYASDNTYQNTPRLFQDTADTQVTDDGMIVGVFAFTVTKKPEHGAKVLQAAMSGNRFIINGSYDSTDPLLSWFSNQQSSEDQNLKNYFNLVDSTGAASDGVVNIFPSTYNVQFLGNGGDGDETVMHTVEGIKEDNPHLTTVQIQAADATLTSPTAEGKYFAGWYTEKNGGGSKVDDQTDIAKLYSTQGGSDNTVKLYSKWEQGRTVTVHKHYPEGASDIQDPDKGDITLYADPTTGKLAQSEIDKLGDMKTPNGYALAGWANTEKNEPDFTNDQLANQTFMSPTNDLYAVWSEMITINFYDNYNHDQGEGKGNQLKSLTLKPKTSIQDNSGQEAPSQPSRPNYTFKEWNTKQNGSGTTITQDDLNTHTFNESTDLFAIWTAAGSDTVTLTFDAVIDAADGTVNPSSITVNKGDTVYKEQITDDPTVTNYTFDGWYKSPAANSTDKADFDAGYQADATETLYAHWKHSGSHPVKVTFKAEGANDVDGPDNKYAEVTIESGDSLGDMMPTNPSKDGSQFKEWNENEGGDGAKFDKDTTVSAEKTVYAQWIDKITVTYNLNGGSAVPNIDDVSGLPSETFNLTETTPTKGTYDFIGWNTKQNGSGDYIEDKNAGENWTFATLSEKAGDAFQDGKVTLYAQWGYVSPPDAGDNAVRVTFDSNANGGASTEANPTYKDVAFGESIGNENMPEPPTRDGYTFKEWNTKQNGMGSKVDGSYTFTQGTDDPDNDYNTTVYAQWTVDTEGGSEKVTITFDTNNGDGQANPPSMEIKKGDALNALPDTPTREGYKFLKWALDKTDDAQAVTVGSPTFENDDTVYAVWEKTLRFDIGYTNPAGDWNKYNQTVYNGTNQPPTYVKIYDITNVGEESKLTDTSNDVTEDFRSHYTLKYHLSSQDASSAATDAPKDVGEYKVVVELDTTDPDAKVSVINPGTLSVVKQGVKVAVTESTQEAKVSSSSENATAPTITVTDAQSAPFSSYDTKYYKWTPSDTSDLTIDAGEVATDATDASALTVGWYVVKVTIIDDNYQIGEVTGRVYDGSGGLPNYAGAAKGENIVFHVLLNDPKATDLKVAKPDGSNLDLKDEDYTTAKPFDPEEKDDTDYYVRADKDTDEVDITVEAEPDYDVKVEFNGQPVEKDPDDGKYHIKDLEGAKEGSSNDVKVTVTPKGASEPVQEYTVHVQRLVEAKIEFKPGNSPYGLIERMSQANGGSWDAAKVQAAKDAFKNSETVYGNLTFNSVDSQYVPDNAEKDVTYTTAAWRSYNSDPQNIETNYDLDETALFVYTKNTYFKDPGVTVYDETGNAIDASAITKSLKVNLLLPSASGTPKYGTAVGAETSEQEINETDIAGVKAFFMTADQQNNDGANKYMVRPDVYELTYTCEYTDPENPSGAKKTATFKRPVVVLTERGDLTFTDLPVVNTSDVAILKSQWITMETRNSLYAFRIADVAMSDLAVVNTSDVAIVKRDWIGGFTEYYDADLLK